MNKDFIILTNYKCKLNLLIIILRFPCYFQGKMSMISN